MANTTLQRRVEIRAVLLNWQTRVVIPLFKKGDRRVCSDCRRTTLLSLPDRIYSGVPERRRRKIEVQCGFCPGRGTEDQLYTLSRALEEAWEFPQPWEFGSGEGLRPRPSGNPMGDSLGLLGVRPFYAGYLLPV